MNKLTCKSLALLLIVLTAGCASIDLSDTADFMSKPLLPGQARVRFIRSACTPLAQHSPQDLFDCGSNIEYDSRILEDGQIKYGEPIEGPIVLLPDTRITYKQVSVAKEPTNRPKNSMYMNGLRGVRRPGARPPVLQTKELLPKNLPFIRGGELWGEEYLVNGNALFADGARMSLMMNDKYIWGQFRLPQKMIMFHFPEGSKVSSAVDLIAPNARYLGSVDASAWLVFDRPAGVMRIKTVSQDGYMEGVAPEFHVEAGKKYDVEYSFGITGISFAIRELLN